MRAIVRKIAFVAAVLLGSALVGTGLWSGTITSTSIIVEILGGAKVIAILCAWALLCFLLLSRVRDETEAHLRGFLESHFDAFTFSVLGTTARVVTKDSLRQFEVRGWTAGALPIIFYRGDSVVYWLLSIPVLLFGGLLISWSWYGIRCLRLLSIQSYSSVGTEPSASPNGGPAASVENPNAPSGPPSMS